MNLNQINFENDESQRHLCLDFLSAAYNLTAKCYNIMEAPKYNVETKAFNMNRKVLISHSLIAGICSMEIFKLVLVIK